MRTKSCSLEGPHRTTGILCLHLFSLISLRFSQIEQITLGQLSLEQKKTNKNQKISLDRLDQLDCFSCFYDRSVLVTSTNCSCFLFRFSSFSIFSGSFISLSISKIFLFHLFMYTTYADVRCCLTSTYPNNSVIDFLTLTFLTECPLKIFNFRVSFLVFLFFALSNFHTILKPIR